MSTATTPDELPELTFDLARELGSFPDFEYRIDDDALSAFRRLTATEDDGSTVVPPGFAAIFGRLGYLREHRMPPGGILLGQDIRWLRPASLERPLVVGARVTSAEVRDGKRTIVFLTTARQDGEVVAQIRITARWPK
jgi:hypothetical protein